MDDPVGEILSTDEVALETSWGLLQEQLRSRFGDTPGIEGILFLVGIQEQGHGFEPRLRKEKKQDLIMRGTNHVLEAAGIYRRGDGSAESITFERAVAMPELSIEQQEKLLRVGIIRYFSSLGFRLGPQ